MKGYAEKPKEKVVKPIPKISVKQLDRIKQYSALNKKFREENPNCQIKHDGCTFTATETHHKKGRIGDRLLDVSTFLSVCASCHKHCEIHPEWAKENGFSEDRTNPFCV